MERFIDEIMSGNTVVIAIAIYILWYLHREAMLKITNLTDAVISLAKRVEVHDVNFKNGTERFDRIEKEVDLVRTRVHEHSSIISALELRTRRGKNEFLD